MRRMSSSSRPSLSPSERSAKAGPSAQSKQPRAVGRPPADPATEGPAVPERLLSAAIRIFAAKGYAKASTREICEAADANVAAIHYYYGGKAGLYQAVLSKPVKDVVRQLPANGACSDMPMDAGLREFYRAFLSPLIQGGDEVADLRRVTLREMIEPSPAFAELVHQSIAPEHEALVQMLAEYCQGPAAQPHVPDTALHQLAFALVAVVDHYWMSLDYMRLLAPNFLDGPQAYEQLLDRLVGYGMAMIEHERQLRQASAHGRAASPARPKSAAKALRK